jgi:hypothetical protein
VQGHIGAITDKDAQEIKRRAFGLLEPAFNELRVTISYVMRHDPSTVEALPVMKKPTVRKPKGDAPPAGTPGPA